MSGGNGASDAELKQWLCDICPVVTRALKLPEPMERAADRALEVIPVATALRWVEMLRLGRGNEVRLIARGTPDAVAKLSSPEGQQAIKSWEATHRVTPVLSALERSVKTIRASWRAGEHPGRAVIRTLAALSVSQMTSDAAGFRDEMAGIIGAQGDVPCLIQGYAATVVANEDEKVENIDRLICRSLPFGLWVRSFWLCLKLKMQGMKSSSVVTSWDHPLWRLSQILREIAMTKRKEGQDA